MLTFNLVKILEDKLKITVVDSFPEEESASLPMVVVQYIEALPRPAQIGGKLEIMQFSYVIHVFGKNKGQRDSLLETIYFYLRDNSLTFYELKVDNGIVVLDTTKPVLGIRVVPQRIRVLPAVSEHPYDRYRGYVDLIIERLI